MSEHRRSLLQAEILMQLDEKPAKTITELAERVDSLRPAVSRSLHSLKKQVLVYRDRNGWHLTEAGRTEAAAAKAMLVESAEKLQNMFERTREVWGRMGVFSETSRAFEGTSALMTAEMIGNKISELTRIVDPSPLFIAQSPVLEMVKAFDESSFGISHTLGAAIQSLLDAQERNGTLLSQLSASIHSFGVEEIARKNNLYLASAINDALAIRQAEFIQLGERVQSSFDFSWISADLVHVNRSFEQLFRQCIEQIRAPSLELPFPVLTENIVVPTGTIAYYTGSLHSFVDAEAMADVPPLADQGFEESGDHSLDTSLSHLNPNFVEMRQGAWSALHGNGPDRLRQASTSQRELLRQLLEHLVPLSLLPEENRQGPQIKARIRVGLRTSESDAEFIDALAKAVLSYYSQLNKYVHHNMKHEESLRSLMHAGEGLIRFILAKANSGRDTLD
jgi:DNA-binding MarR family transcriptional regulator